MYNLLVAYDTQAWEGGRYALDRTRIGEYTVESLKTRYATLDDAAGVELTSFPALFAYEKVHGLPARVGRISRIRDGTAAARIEFDLLDEIAPIPIDKVLELAWELDLGVSEMNRTHWAVKDVDLAEVLRDSGLVSGRALEILESLRSELTANTGASLTITPTVFAIPNVVPDTKLAALMMPFSAEFNPVADAIRDACRNAGLRCERVNDIWEESTIIQDVFNLIFRSAVVIVDLSDRNANVLYETGIAHTLGRPVIPISQMLTNLPFDLAHHRALEYSPSEPQLSEMRQKLEKRLRHLTA